MNYSIYFSPTGGTKKVADAITATLFNNCIEIDLCEDTKPLYLCDDDVCIISVPSYGGRVPSIVIERLANFSASGTKAVLNCVYGNRDWEDTLTELQDTLEKSGFVCVAAVAAVAEHSIFRQYATGRPNADDVKEIGNFATQIKATLSKNEFSPLKLSGNHGTYKEYKVGSLKPHTNDECRGCGICAKECPAHAIDTDNPKNTNEDKCIGCMRCVAICHRNARSCDEELIKTMSEKMATVLGGHKNNHLFLSE